MKTIKFFYYTAVALSCVLWVMLSCIAFGQTIEDRVRVLEQHKDKVDSAFGWTSVITPDSGLSKPIYEGTVMSSNMDCYMFNPAFMRNGLWTTYVNKAGGIYLATSPNGLNSWTLTLSNAPYGSIIYPNGEFKGSAHKWFGQYCDNYTYGSYNGLDWWATSIDRTQQSGEDRNLLYDNGLYRNYIRVQPLPRTIGYTQSTNFFSWLPIVEVLKPDGSDLSTEQFYQMSVIKTPRGYFGLLTVYRIGNSGQDVWQVPPYAEEEHTTDLQLVYSANGRDNWIRLNGRNPIVDRRPGVKQIFGWWSVIGNTAYTYTAESKRRHTTWDNNNNYAGNYYYSSRYKIDLDELYKYLPQ